MKKIKYILILIFTININLSVLQSSESCKYKVDKLHKALLINSKLKKSFQEKYIYLNEINLKVFNSHKMIRIIYGRKWGNLTENQKTRLSEKFLNYMSYNYAKRFSELDNAQFIETGIENFGDKKSLVKTYLSVKNEKKVDISYLCSLEHNKEWKIFDVIINESISEISTKKSDFAQTISEKGIDGLIEVLDSKMIFD